MKSLILFFIKGYIGDPAQIKRAREIGAQFRNSDLAGDIKEKCDFVAGVVPSQYKDTPVFETLEDITDFLLGEDTDGDGVGDEEVTREKLEQLSKDNLVAFAGENDIELTKADKKTKDSLIDVISDHLDID